MPTANGTATIHRLPAINGRPKFNLKPVGDVVLLRRYDSVQDTGIELLDSTKAAMLEETALCYVEAISDEPLSEGKTRTYGVGSIVLVNPSGCNSAWLKNVAPEGFILCNHNSILFVCTEK